MHLPVLSLHKKEKRKQYLTLALAFLTPVVVLGVLFVFRAIYPFGEQMYLRSDMYHQYAPFLKLFQTTLKEGGSLAYTWNIGLGSNFYSTYAYYLASPINWLAGLFPAAHLTELMSCFIIFKAGLMSAFTAYYLQKHFKSMHYAAAGFGIFYAMSGYMAAYSWNLMWLDCLVLLPLLLLGLERLVKEGKCVLYTVSFALAVLSNYYIAIMLCIFSVLYFLYLLCAETEYADGILRSLLRKTGRYLLYSLLGGLMGAVVFLPAFYSLFGTASADSSFPSAWRAYFNLLELIAQGTMNMEVTMMKGYLPNIYSSMVSFLLVPLFWLNPKIPIAQRVGKTVLLLLLVIGFSFNIPAYIWHGFHFPNSLPARQSFLFIFLVLVIGYESFLKMQEVSLRSIFTCFGVCLAGLFALQALFASKTYTLAVCYAGAGFLCLYLPILLLRRRKKTVLRYIATFLFLVLCVAEACVNTDVTAYSTTSRTNYVNDNEAIAEVLGQIEDTDFYRVEKKERRTRNDAAWSNYRSASVFSSVTPDAQTNFYAAFGMQNSTNAFSFYGNTPFTAALLNVRYVLSNDESNQDKLQSLVAHKDDVYLYRNTYQLPFAFMVNETIEAEVNLTSLNPFLVQNDFLDAAKHLPPIFAVEETRRGSHISYTAKESGRLYFYLQDKMDSITITKENGSAAGSSHTFSSLISKMIVDAGEVQAGDAFTLSTTDEEISDFSVVPAVFTEEVFAEAVEALSENPFTVTSFTDTSVAGQVNVTKAGMLFTTIPYDKGWHVTVDGKKAETSEFYDAFLMVHLEEGRHEITFSYTVPGLLLGAVLSAVSLAVFVLLTVWKKKTKKTQKDLKNMEKSVEIPSSFK